ncbi:MAG TPA: orotidine-5'-phosphate decarboxylase [Rhodospirillales bacterium]|nr:orotidine-5'-phosphate decarboxylase [Rhodospirillaceae bacterium]HJO74997.1 orotidine-5'-phosphate decarboxylase [Rhodospirillales bacterium]
MKPSDRIFVALDTTDLEGALTLGRNLKGLIGGVKVGKEFFTALGPDGVKAVSELGLPVFLDLKFHDIPATVAGAVKAATALKPFMLNVHASGGGAMMRAAVDAAGNAPERPLVLAVTVLTSMGDDDLAAAGIPDTAGTQVQRLANLAKDSGIDGVVCSALEAETLRADLGDDFKLVVPGIRPEWAAANDQKRIVTPSQAVALGADYLVIGRPITGADDPAIAARRIADEL